MSTIIYCPNCGATIFDSTEKCPKCGCSSFKLKRELKRKEKETKRMEEARMNPEQRVYDYSFYPDDDINPNAERFLNILLKIWLVFIWAIIIISIISGLVISVNEEELLPFLIGLGFGILVGFSGYLMWAVSKVFLNISNNLYKLNIK